jgi:hypothetical protein
MRLKIVDKYVTELSPKLESEYTLNRKCLSYRKKTNIKVLHETADDLANKVYNDSKVIILLSAFSAMLFCILAAIVKTQISIFIGIVSLCFGLFILTLNNMIANHVVQRLVDIGIKKGIKNEIA